MADNDASQPWFEDESLWENFYHCMFAEESFLQAQTLIPSILELSGVEPTKVLDLACGPGRFAIPLAQQGFAVDAVDLSAFLLAKGQQRSAKTSAKRPGSLDNLAWIEADMRAHQQTDSYDLILSMWTSFGYFDDMEDDLIVLQRCYDNLRSGGALLIDTVGKEYMTRNIQAVHLREMDDDSLLIERPIMEREMTRVNIEWILVQGEKAFRREFSHHVYSGQELRDRLLSVGFDDVALYGNLGGDEYDLDADRLVAVAWKD